MPTFSPSLFSNFTSQAESRAVFGGQALCIFTTWAQAAQCARTFPGAVLRRAPFARWLVQFNLTTQESRPWQDGRGLHYTD